MAKQLTILRSTAAEWSSSNPSLVEGEMGIDTTTYWFKIGSGSTAWNDLPYASGPSASFATNAIYAETSSITETCITYAYYEESSSFASQSFESVSASYADTASHAFFAETASYIQVTNIETASAAYAGVGGFNVLGILDNTSQINNAYGDVFYLNSGSTLLTTNLQMFGGNGIHWANFPELFLIPAIHPQTDYGWMVMKQTGWSSSFDKFRGLKVEGDLWVNNLTASTFHGTASYSDISETASYAFTASHALFVSGANVVGCVPCSISSSYSSTASFVENFNINSVSTASRVIISQSYANKFFSLLAGDYAEFGPLHGSGKVYSPGLTWNPTTLILDSYTDWSIAAKARLLGTASFADTASHALNADTASVSITNYVTQSIFQTSSSFASSSISSSYSFTSSYALNAGGMNVSASLTSSYLYTTPLGVSRWNVYLDSTNGNLIFEYK